MPHFILLGLGKIIQDLFSKEGFFKYFITLQINMNWGTQQTHNSMHNVIVSFSPCIVSRAIHICCWTLKLCCYLFKIIVSQQWLAVQLSALSQAMNSQVHCLWNWKPSVMAFCYSMAMKVGIACADIYCVLLQRNKGRRTPKPLLAAMLRLVFWIANSKI